MKKLYSLFLLMLLLPTAAMAQNEFSLWLMSYNGSTEIYSDAAMTNLVIADYGSQDGAETEISETTFPDGLYLKMTPDEGYILSSIFINGTDFILDAQNNTCHIDLADIDEPEYGVDITIEFDVPFTLTLLSNGPGTIKAFQDEDSKHEIFSGGYVTNSDFFWGFFIHVTPDEGCALQSLVVNDEDVTASVNNGIYIARDLYSDVTVIATFTEQSAGINDINADNNDQSAEIYDLNGRRIHPDNTSTGVRIIRQGNKTSKIVIKK